MYRQRNTNARGGQWDQQTMLAVWNKAGIVANVNSSARRMDACGAWIDWGQYGNTAENGTGWEIDHIKPIAAGGTDDLSNLQALQWQNNRTKGDQWPGQNYCLVKASR